MQIYILQDDKVVSQFNLANLIIHADHNNPRFTISHGKYFPINRRFDIVKFEGASEEEDSIPFYIWLKRCRANRIITAPTGLISELAGVADDWTTLAIPPADIVEAIYEWDTK